MEPDVVEWSVQPPCTQRLTSYHADRPTSARSGLKLTSLHHTHTLCESATHVLVTGVASRRILSFAYLDLDPCVACKSNGAQIASTNLFHPPQQRPLARATPEVCSSTLTLPVC